MNRSEVLFIGTFPPRECGIATFTKDLTDAIDKKCDNLKTKVCAMNKNGTNIYNYSKKVKYQISDTDISEYITTANKINKKDSIKLINIQHEFGIFGGEYGSYLIAFLEIIKKPVVITLHTVLPNPNEQLKKIVKQLAEKSDCLIVMTKTGVNILRNDYEIESEIQLVPHGIPTVHFESNKKEKKKMGYKDKQIVLSFGMMNSGKGYEHVIESLPEVIKKVPNLLYIIIGETHPVVRKNEGEQYRNSLEDKIKELGIESHVKFYNKYVTLKEIIKYLQSSDLYICANQNPNQITSGTLVYALGSGRAVISTPFLHAKDIVSEERGILAKFNDHQSFSKGMIKILTNPKLKESMEQCAYSYSRPMIWSNVALKYSKIFRNHFAFTNKYSLPEVNLKHLQKMTDKFAMLQFSNYLEPDNQSGYTLDDNARALIVCCMKNENNSTSINLIKKYLNFIKYVQQPDGKMYNIVNFQREIDLENWSEDAHGRALWALGKLHSTKSIPQDIKDLSTELLNKSLSTIENIKSPRAVAFMIIGLSQYKSNSKILNKTIKLADHLVNLYNDNSNSNWQWFEKYLTYSNSKLPESLFYAYSATGNKEYLRIAKITLDFLISITLKDNNFIPIGHDGWYIENGNRAHYDQQPVDVASMVQTLILANKITTENKYIEHAMTTFHWFLGHNTLSQVIYDTKSGGCHDGIGQHSINLNQGAESTISYLIARLSLEELKISID